MRITTILLLLFFTFNIYSQTVIEMEKYNGVYKIECKINGIPMDFIFDTGASNVSISSTEALFLIKQGLITEDDFIGNVNYKIANGKTLEGTKINLKTIEIQGLVLKNVTATIVHELNSPLLLGQSVLTRLGKITIENNKLIIHNNRKKNSDKLETEVEETITWLNSKVKKFQLNEREYKFEYELSIKKIKNNIYIEIIEDFKNETLMSQSITLIPVSDINYIYFREGGYDDKGYTLQINMKFKDVLKTKAKFYRPWLETKETFKKRKNYELTHLPMQSAYVGPDVYSISLNNEIDVVNLKTRMKKAFDYLKEISAQITNEKF